MIISLTRDYTKGEYTHGHLSIDGVRICSTLENSNAQVPPGEYVITLLKCNQYARKMPLIFPQPSSLIPQPCCDLCPKLKFVCINSTLPCYCPMLKPGNGVHNRLDGSILVGQYNCLNSLIHPKTVFDALYERIRKSISRGNKVTITITEGGSLNPHPSTLNQIFV